MMFVKTTTYTYFLCWSWNIFMVKCIDLLHILVVAKTRGTAVFLPFYFLLYVTFGYEYNMKTISLPSTQMIYPALQYQHCPSVSAVIDAIILGVHLVYCRH